MAMELSIALENSERSFYSGDIIRGKVLFNITKPNAVLLNGTINIKFQGKVEWEWQERKFNDDISKKVKKSHIYFEDGYRFGLGNSTEKDFIGNNLYEQKSIEPLDDSEYYQEEDKYIFPFEYCLPEDLPPSLSCKYGSILYTIEATYRELRKRKAENLEASQDANWIICKAVRCNFGVNSTLDLNKLTYLHAHQPMQVKDYRNVCSFFHCKLSPVFATFKIEKCGFALGEEIHFNAEIRNMSSRSVQNIQMGIFQELTCTALIECVTYRHVYRRKITDICHFDILKGDYDHWEDKILVPIIPPTWSDPENIIEIRYFVKLSMKIFTLPLQTLELTLPIVVGTIPIRPNINVVAAQNHTNCIRSEDGNDDNYIDEDLFGEDPEVMEAFQIDEEADMTQYSTLSAVQFPLRTISGAVFEAENRHTSTGTAGRGNPLHESLFP